MTLAANWYILPPSITEVLQKQVSGGGGGGGGGGGRGRSERVWLECSGGAERQFSAQWEQEVLLKVHCAVPVKGPLSYLCRGNIGCQGCARSLRNK